MVMMPLCVCVCACKVHQWYSSGSNGDDYSDIGVNRSGAAAHKHTHAAKRRYWGRHSRCNGTRFDKSDKARHCSRPHHTRQCSSVHGARMHMHVQAHSKSKHMWPVNMYEYCGWSHISCGREPQRCVLLIDRDIACSCLVFYHTHIYLKCSRQPTVTQSVGAGCWLDCHSVPALKNANLNMHGQDMQCNVSDDSIL